MLDTSGFTLDPDAQEFAPLEWAETDLESPLFPQWWKMIRTCYDPAYQLYRFGTECAWGWHAFAKFKAEMQSTFEDRPATEKRLIDQNRFLRRIEVRKAFSKSNCTWTHRGAAVAVQKRTVILDTPWGPMTFRQLAKHLHDHQGEPLPDGVPRAKYTVIDYPAEFRDPVKVELVQDSIHPVPVHQLRLRHRRNENLYAPVRTWGNRD